MQNTKEIPYFTLYLTHPAKHYSWCIVLDGEVIHQITNFMRFFRALGYPDISPKVFVNKGNMSADESILIEFSDAELGKENGKNSEKCLQNKITEYLIENSEQFRTKYQEYYNSLMGSCISLDMQDNKNCINCKIRQN